jgi:hypothetical protein
MLSIPTHREGATSRARRALITLESMPCADTLGAARRALARLQRVTDSTHEAHAVRHALAWLEWGFADQVPQDARPIIKNAHGWLNAAFPLQLEPQPIGRATRRTHAQHCNETGQAFASFADASRVLGISRGDMAKYRRGEASNAGGFTFSRVPLVQAHAQHAANDSSYRKS